MALSQQKKIEAFFGKERDKSELPLGEARSSTNGPSSSSNNLKSSIVKGGRSSSSSGDDDSSGGVETGINLGKRSFDLLEHTDSLLMTDSVVDSVDVDAEDQGNVNMNDDETLARLLQEEEASLLQQHSASQSASLLQTRALKDIKSDSGKCLPPSPLSNPYSYLQP